MPFFWLISRAAEESIDSLIEDKEDTLDEIKAKIKAYKQIIDLKQRQGAALSDQIEAVNAQVNSLELEIDVSKKELDQLNADIKTLTERIEQKEVVIVSQKKFWLRSCGDPIRIKPISRWIFWPMHRDLRTPSK